MSIMKICTFPQQVLSQTAEPVSASRFGSAELEKIAQDMIETMYHEHGVGLAAQQVGITDRIFVMDVSDSRDEPQVCINPEIIEEIGETTCPHGCLSLPGTPGGNVKRAAELKVKFYDVTGKEHEKHITDLEARCFQHELDHLNGMLYIDRLSKLKRDMLLEKYKKYLKKHQS